MGFRMLRFRPGDVIPASYLNQVSGAIEDNRRAIMMPRQLPDLDLDHLTNSGAQGAAGIVDEVFDAGPSDMTEETFQTTDSNNDTHDHERTTQVIFTEQSTGRKITLNLSYT